MTNLEHTGQGSEASERIVAYLSCVQGTLGKLPLNEIELVVGLLRQARAERKRVFLFGNGGSAATASHLACDLGKGTNGHGRPRLRVVALTDNMPLISAWANDSSYEEVFAQQLVEQVEPGDIVIGISASGNSRNVLNGIRVAKSAGAITVGLTGFDGGELKNQADHCIVVPDDSIDQVEDVHLMLGHIIASCLRS
ncbi:MAG: SIS domain-containing protein [Dehalococcoidia bacterium]|nr:SIS domain-containing protein [Dehalococcoidia bacterium]